MEALEAGAWILITTALVCSVAFLNLRPLIYNMDSVDLICSVAQYDNKYINNLKSLKVLLDIRM